MYEMYLDDKNVIIPSIAFLSSCAGAIVVNMLKQFCNENARSYEVVAWWEHALSRNIIGSNNM